MLLNLAEYLHACHDVCIVFDKSQNGSLFLKAYSAISAISLQEVRMVAGSYDVLVAHLPYGRDEIINLPIPRKLIVSMEVLSQVPMLIDEECLDRCDGMLYLHDEQIA